MEKRFSSIVDIMRVPARGDASVAIRPVEISKHPVERRCDVLIVGGGTGGVAATIACARMGMNAVLLEETDWIGGQLTAQGISALDEHDYIEYFGGTSTYYALREGIRRRYRATYPRLA